MSGNSQDRRDAETKREYEQWALGLLVGRCGGLGDPREGGVYLELVKVKKKNKKKGNRQSIQL